MAPVGVISRFRVFKESANEIFATEERNLAADRERRTLNTDGVMRGRAVQTTRDSIALRFVESRLLHHYRSAKEEISLS